MVERRAHRRVGKHHNVGIKRADVVEAGLAGRSLSRRRDNLPAEVGEGFREIGTRCDDGQAVVATSTYNTRMRGLVCRHRKQCLGELCQGFRATFPVQNIAE